MDLLTVDLAAIIYQGLSMNEQLTLVGSLNRQGQRLVREHPFLLTNIVFCEDPFLSGRLRKNYKAYRSWLGWAEAVLRLSGQRLRYLIIFWNNVPDLIPLIVGVMQPRRLKKIIFKGHVSTFLDDLVGALEQSERSRVELIFETCSCWEKKMIKFHLERHCRRVVLCFQNNPEYICGDKNN